MGRRVKRSEEEDSGAPEWMVTFSDCMTLLLTFFVLLLSFSSFDNKEFNKANLLILGRSPSLKDSRRSAREALLAREQIRPAEEFEKGSEKPTLSESKESYQRKQPPLVDFRNRRMFSISSKRVFWGQGTVISSEGREAFSSLARFLNGVPNRIVISENGHSRVDGGLSGLSRAWTVVQYLTTKGGLEKGRFSISTTSFAEEQADEEGGQSSGSGVRMVEIVLLERSINN